MENDKGAFYTSRRVPSPETLQHPLHTDSSKVKHFTVPTVAHLRAKRKRQLDSCQLDSTPQRGIDHLECKYPSGSSPIAEGQKSGGLAFPDLIMDLQKPSSGRVSAAEIPCVVNTDLDDPVAC